MAKVLEFQLQHSPSNEYSGLISFRMDWLDLFAVQGTLKSLLQHHTSKASILQHSAVFIVAHPLNDALHAPPERGYLLLPTTPKQVPPTQLDHAPGFPNTQKNVKLAGSSPSLASSKLPGSFCYRSLSAYPSRLCPPLPPYQRASTFPLGPPSAPLHRRIPPHL